MQLQVALDRLSIPAAADIAAAVRPHADWIEVGTSLIKEFGMDSVRRLRSAAPDRLLLADIKTNDNAAYEFGLCFNAGADAATVMGTADTQTLDICLAVADTHRRTVMIDLLGTSEAQQQQLLRYPAVFAVHVSKDVQEADDTLVGASAPPTRRLPAWASDRQVAVAGGITVDEIAPLGQQYPHLIVIVGSAITGAENPAAAARAFADAIAPYPARELLSP